MPYPVYPAQNQTAQQIANIGSNLGIAMFGDANSMMRRQQLDQDFQYKQKMLDLQRQELGMKQGLTDSQIQLHNAQAQQYQQQNQGASDLGDIIANASRANPDGTITIDPAQIGALAGAHMRANPNGNVAQLLRGLSALSVQQRQGNTEDDYRRAAALDGKMPGENTAFTTGQADKLQKPIQIQNNASGIIAPPNSPYSQAIQDYGNAQNPNQEVPPAVLPNGQGNQYYTPNGAPASAATPRPLPPSDPNGFTSVDPAAQPSVADVVAPAPAGPRMQGSALVLPGKTAAAWGTASSRAKSAEKYSEGASESSTLAAKAHSLIDTGSYNLVNVPGGGIPAVESVAKFIVSQTDGKKRDAMNQLQSLLTGDWLEKSKVMKGALTEREGSELRKDQPHFGDKPEVIKNWLERVAYLADMNAALDSANFEAATAGRPPVNPIAFKQAYSGRHQAPSNMKLYFGDKSQSEIANSFRGTMPANAPQPLAPPTSADRTRIQQQQSSGPAPGTVEDGHVFLGGNPADPANWKPVQQ